MTEPSFLARMPKRWLMIECAVAEPGPSVLPAHGLLDARRGELDERLEQFRLRPLSRPEPEGFPRFMGFPAESVVEEIDSAQKTTALAPLSRFLRGEGAAS